MQKIAIIIPCYNEELRLHYSNFEPLFTNLDCDVFLANDGSTDATVSVINKITSNNPNRCFLLNYTQNSGKATTIYKAFKEIHSRNHYDYLGYFDADFSTPSTEILRILEELKNLQPEFLFASRIQLLNSGIQRKYYRHIIGRIIVTLLNLKFRLGIYDTQCGAKLFSSSMISIAFEKPFFTSWLFDVEIFIRLKKQSLLHLGKEIPVYNWKDVEGSKLGFKTGFKILRELYLLNKNY